MKTQGPRIIPAAALIGTGALAKDTAYIGSIEVVAGDAGEMARGTVFLDANRNSTMDDGEAGVAGVLVSNGREVVVTGDDGSFELPTYEDMNRFITKPAGYASPVDEYLVPQFNYIHKVAGSPDLRFGGIEPTGPLPATINFPQIEDNSARDGFECLVFGDAQTCFNMQVSHVRETAGRMLAARRHERDRVPAVRRRRDGRRPPGLPAFQGDHRRR